MRHFTIAWQASSAATRARGDLIRRNLGDQRGTAGALFMLARVAQDDGGLKQARGYVHPRRARLRAALRSAKNWTTGSSYPWVLVGYCARQRMRADSSAPLIAA